LRNEEEQVITTLLSKYKGTEEAETLREYVQEVEVASWRLSVPHIS